MENSYNRWFPEFKEKLRAKGIDTKMIDVKIYNSVAAFINGLTPEQASDEAYFNYLGKKSLDQPE